MDVDECRRLHGETWFTESDQLIEFTKLFVIGGGVIRPRYTVNGVLAE